jgi:hypothetical protein
MSGSGDDLSELRDIVCQFPGGFSRPLSHISGARLLANG